MTLDSILAGPVVGLLALLGAVALVWRLLGAAARLGLASVEASAASSMAETSIRHGDLTGMAEQLEQALAVRRVRRQTALLALLWIALLLVPIPLDATRPVYALCAALWLLPRRPILLRGRPRRGRRVEVPKRP